MPTLADALEQKKKRLKVVPEVNLAEYEQVIAKITDTFLGREDHGIFTFMIGLDYGGTAQGAGSYTLDSNSKEWAIDDKEYQTAERVGSAAGLTLIMAVLDACGVDSWEKLKGRTIFALRDKTIGWGAPVVGFAPLPTERGRAVIFKDIFDRYLEE